MIAAVLNELPATTLELADLAKPGPWPGGVLVGVSVCGVCGTDLHVMAGESYRPTLPFVLGHEFAGTVTAAAGPGESDWLGRRVVPTLFVGCGACPPCHAGDERLCEAGAQIVGVLGYHGGFAGYVALGADQLVELPATVPDEVGASLVDSGATAQNAVRSALAASPYGQARHLVLGGGPLACWRPSCSFWPVSRSLSSKRTRHAAPYSLIACLSPLSRSRTSTGRLPPCSTAQGRPTSSARRWSVCGPTASTWPSATRKSRNWTSHWSPAESCRSGASGPAGEPISKMSSRW